MSDPIVKLVPQAINLDPEDRDLLAKLGAQQQAVQATFQQFAVAGERRMYELQEAGAAAWKKLGEKYDFDPERVQYVLEGDQIVPKAVRL